MFTFRSEYHIWIVVRKVAGIHSPPGVPSSLLLLPQQGTSFSRCSGNGALTAANERTVEHAEVFKQNKKSKDSFLLC